MALLAPIFWQQHAHLLWMLLILFCLWFRVELMLLPAAWLPAAAVSRACGGCGLAGLLAWPVAEGFGGINISVCQSKSMLV